MIEIALHKSPQPQQPQPPNHPLHNANHSISPSGFQPLRSHIVSSYYEDDESEIFDEKEIKASHTSSLSNFTAHRRRPQTHQVASTQAILSQVPLTPAASAAAPSPSAATGGVPAGGVEYPLIVPYSLSDVKLSLCLYAGPACFESETILTEVRPHCRQVVYSKSDENTVAIVAKSLSSSKSINLLLLYLDPHSHFNTSPAVLMGRLRKMGYCGFAILIADVATSPDTSDRFLKCGGDGILSKPVLNRRAIHRVLIGTYPHSPSSSSHLSSPLSLALFSRPLPSSLVLRVPSFVSKER
jgi:hypothetical protein